MSLEPLRRVPSVHPKPDMLQTVPIRIHPQPNPKYKRPAAGPYRSGGHRCLGCHITLLERVRMLGAEDLGYLGWQMPQYCMCCASLLPKSTQCFLLVRGGDGQC